MTKSTITVKLKYLVCETERPEASGISWRNASTQVEIASSATFDSIRSSSKPHGISKCGLAAK